MAPTLALQIVDSVYPLINSYGRRRRCVLPSTFLCAYVPVLVFSPLLLHYSATLVSRYPARLLLALPPPSYSTILPTRAAATVSPGASPCRIRNLHTVHTPFSPLYALGRPSLITQSFLPWRLLGLDVCYPRHLPLPHHRVRRHVRGGRHRSSYRQLFSRSPSSHTVPTFPFPVPPVRNERGPPLTLPAMSHESRHIPFLCPVAQQGSSHTTPVTVAQVTPTGCVVLSHETPWCGAPFNSFSTA